MSGGPHQLPPGVHPHDRTPVGPTFEESLLQEPESHTRTTKPPWQVTPEKAMPVYQRLGLRSSARLVVVNTGFEGGVGMAVGKQKGRAALRLWVPSNVPSGGSMIVTPAGVLLAEDEAEVQQGQPVPLNVGESIQWYGESEVWVAVQPGQATGYVAVAHFFNAPGRD